MTDTLKTYNNRTYYKRPDSFSERFTVTLTKEADERLRFVAEQTKKPFAVVAREYIEQGLDRDLPAWRPRP